MKKTILIVLLIFVTGCLTNLTSFQACMDFCVDEIDQRCNYHTSYGEIQDCDGEIKQNVSKICFDECKVR